VNLELWRYEMFQGKPEVASRRDTCPSVTFRTQEIHDFYRSRSVVTIGDNDGLDA
jgi:hypothetical protein